MAKFPAKVVFPDGTVLLAIHNDGVATMRPELYCTETERSAGWDRISAHTAAYPDLTKADDDEVVAVHCDEDGISPPWRGRASRRRMILLGPLSFPDDPTEGPDGVLRHEREAAFGIPDLCAAPRRSRHPSEETSS